MPDQRTRVIEGVRETGTSFLIGSPSFIRRDDKQADFFNSAFLIDPNGNVIGKYDKVHLVPFGEYVPLQEWFPFIGKLVEEVGDFKSGQKGQTLPWGEFPLGIQICYEMIFPDLSREMARNQAAFLINMTNDAWYGKTSAPYQHFSMAVFRAVENRRSLIRSANTGISGFIDPVGRIIASTPLFEEAVITRSMPVLKTESFYTRYGDVFALTCMAISILLFFFCAISPKQIYSLETHALAIPYYNLKEAHHVFGNQTDHQGTESKIRTVQGVSLTWLARKDD